MKNQQTIANQELNALLKYMFEQTVPGLTYQQEHILMMLQAFTFIRFADASL